MELDYFVLLVQLIASQLLDTLTTTSIKLGSGQIRWKKAYQLYQLMLINFKIFNASFGHILILPSFLCILVILMILDSAVLILFNDQFSIFTSVCFVSLNFVHIGWLKYGFQLANRSRQTTDDLLGTLRKHSRNDPYKLKRLDAYQPIALQVGPFFVVSRTTALTIYELILDKVCSLLIMHRESLSL